MGRIVLTKPSGVPGIPGTVIPGVEIAPLSTVIVDAISSNVNIGAKWIYTIMDSTDQQVLTAEIVANHQFENQIRWNRYGLVGDMMPHGVEVVLNGSNLELRITNTHNTNTYTANIVRIQLLS